MRGLKYLLIICHAAECDLFWQKKKKTIHYKVYPENKIDIIGIFSIIYMLDICRENIIFFC